MLGVRYCPFCALRSIHLLKTLSTQTVFLLFTTRQSRSLLSERKTKQKRRQQQLVTPAASIMQRYRQLRKRKEETRVKSNVKLTALARSAESAEHNVSQNRLGAKVNSHTASGRVLTHAAMHTAGRVAER